MDKPKFWVKNIIEKKNTVESESWSWVKISNCKLSIFDPNNPVLFRV